MRAILLLRCALVAPIGALAAQVPNVDPAGAVPAAAATPAAAVEFVRDVAPILEQRCIGCHGPRKQKGDLRLDRREHAFPAAGEGSIAPGDPETSELMRRVQLPKGDEDVMPNEGERLGDAQIETLRRWIAAGADWPAEGDAYFVAAEQRAVVPRIDFGIAAPEAATQARVDAALAALGERGVLAQRVAADTPAVDVNAALCGKAFGDAELALLADLAPVLVWLNLARTAVTDAGMGRLASLAQLRRLNLANTAVGDAGMTALGALPRLEVLNVYGTKVGDGGLAALGQAAALQKVYAFATPATAAGAAALQAARPGVAVDRGEYAEQRLQAALAEVAARAERERPVNSTCPVSGEAIVGDQVVVHEGLRIAFCCAKCKARFAKDPAEFAAKIAEYRAAGAVRGGEPALPPTKNEAPPEATPTDGTRDEAKGEAGGGGDAKDRDAKEGGGQPAPTRKAPGGTEDV